MIDEVATFSDEKLYEALEQSKEFGFLSPQPINRQIEHSKSFISLIPTFKGHVLDLGAGGGLPCLVWLNIDPDVYITAVDAMNKRTKFLSEIKEKNKSLFEGFNVINGRAEELAHRDDLREKFDIVVARGFGPPCVTAECASGFLKVGGKLIVSGRPENEILRWDKPALRKLRLSVLEVRGEKQCHAIIFEKHNPLPKRFPRSAPLVKKKPLW